MGLIPAGVLTQTLTVLAATRASNGAGGWTNTWASAGTVRGSITARRRTTQEVLAGGQPTDAEIVDVYADASSVPITGASRIQGPDGSTYELVSITRQGPLVFAIGRAV